MFNIKHNGRSKEVDGSLEEINGLLIVSGRPKWEQVNAGNGVSYLATFVDSRIHDRCSVQSIKATSVNPAGTSTTDLTVSECNVLNGMLTILINDSNVVEHFNVITCTLFDVTAINTPFANEKSAENVTVSFSNWELPTSGSRLNRHGKVTVKIEDANLAPFLATIVPDTLELFSDSAELEIHGIREVLPDGRFVCYFYPTGVEEVVTVDSVSDASVSFKYITRKHILATLPEATANWIERQDDLGGGTYYLSIINADLPNGMFVDECIMVRGENGEEFPGYDDLLGKRPPAMHSYVSEDNPNEIYVSWTRDTVPPTTKLTAEVYLRNYESKVPEL